MRVRHGKYYGVWFVHGTGSGANSGTESSQPGDYVRSCGDDTCNGCILYKVSLNHRMAWQ